MAPYLLENIFVNCTISLTKTIINIATDHLNVWEKSQISPKEAIFFGLVRDAQQMLDILFII